jgi:thiol:disulfide interchange protein DsbD
MGSWIAVAVVTGMYLLNVFRLPGDSETKTVGPLRCMFSVGFFGLAAYIAVGVFSATSPEGALWQQIVAFGPAQIDVAESEEGYVVEHDGLEYLLDFDEAVETASLTDTLMFLDFTGVDCQNCRLMEERVLPKEFVKEAISDLVRVQLYTDKIPGVKANPELHEKLLARNHELQDRWFGTTAIPAYAIVTPDGKQILSRFVGLDRSGNSQEFRAFLNAGLEKGNNVSATAIAKAPRTAATESTMAQPAAQKTSAIQSASFVVE